ncbi:Rrf2 family transcriptional regulator [Cytophagales bacterium LB-30]|uniref:Rrf2 family transcriptional regulator n=1 Tax=Shiella aurantiaca TaxID=3058365 RepID=A0ABT8F467_9BACT|nr:Rrf2 family transcriptional regulator [Shiella aurantiaca]MDN4165011.1 Rrf2 family transcriptional regulator [Shiella aurantiaca]
MFSKTCEYAIRATIYIALRALEGERASLADIAQEIGSPKAFTAKILQQLVHHGLVDSQKGRTGGFSIEEADLHTIKLSDIVRAVDGDNLYTVCSLGMKACSETRPCPVHHQYKFIREKMIKMMDENLIINLAQGLKEGRVFLIE